MANENENVNPEPKIEEQPTPQISGAPAGQTYAQAGDSGVTLEDVLASPELQDYIDKRVKSQQDTRLGKYGTRLDNLEGAIAEYNALVKGGMSEPQALAKMQGDKKLQDLEAEIQALKSGNVATPSAGAGEKKLLTEKQASILSNANLKTDDPRFTEFLRDNVFPSNEAYLEALDTKALEWQQQDAKKPQPSSSTVAQPVPQVPAGSGEWTAEKYKTEMLAAIGDKDKIKAIKAAAKKDGVDVDNIGFV